MKKESNWNGDPRMRRSREENRERPALAEPGAEVGGTRDASMVFNQGADGRIVMSGGLGKGRQPTWGPLAMAVVAGARRAWRGDGHARAAQREADWYRF